MFIYISLAVLLLCVVFVYYKVVQNNKVLEGKVKKVTKELHEHENEMKSFQNYVGNLFSHLNKQQSGEGEGETKHSSDCEQHKKDDSENAVERGGEGAV